MAPARVAVLLFIAVSIAGAGALAAPRMSQSTASILSRAAIDRAPLLPVSVVAREGRFVELRRQLRGWGAAIVFEHAPSGYFSLILPTAKFPALANAAAAQAVAVDYLSVNPSEADAGAFLPPTDAQTGGLDWSNRPDPFSHPYSVLNDMDYAAFHAQAPLADGRGIVVGHIETGLPDFRSPELQTALDRAGRPVAKFLDVVKLPGNCGMIQGAPERCDGRWVKLRPREAGPGWTGTLQVPRRYLPAQLLRPDENEQTIGFGVLWSPALKKAWIDADRDGSFEDETAVGEYRTTQTFGRLGTDDPRTRAVEGLAYAVQIDNAGGYLAVNFGNSGHATLVAGALAGSKGTHGRIAGVAPGAQIVSFDAPLSIAGFARALIAAYDDTRVDLVLFEGYTAITLAESNDGRSVLGLVLSRLEARTHKPCFVTGGNKWNMQALIDVGMSPNAIEVSASHSRAALLSAYGIRAGLERDLHFVGAGGPGSDGQIKPDLLAPAVGVGLWALFDEKNHGNLPPYPIGYSISGGTSTATPVAAGAGALLMSTFPGGRKADGRLVTRALREGARYDAVFPAYLQGYGFLSVGAAWERYKTLNAARKSAMRVALSAAVHTVESDRLATPGRGVGLFEREGWKVGDKGRRMLQLTRTGGSAQALEFSVAIDGNDGTYSAPATIVLPRGRTVELPVDIAPVGTGPHSSLLRLFHRNELVVSAGLTIVTPHEFDPAKGHAFEARVNVPPAGRTTVFFRVPPGVDAMTFTIAGADMWGWNMLVQPDGDVAGSYVTDMVLGRKTFSIWKPMPGVWELSFANMRELHRYDWSAAGKELAPTPVTVRGAVASVVMTAAKPDLRLTLENRQAPLYGALRTTDIAAVRATDVTLKRGETRVFDIEAPTAGIVGALAKLSHGRDLPQFTLYDCTGKCHPRRRAAVGGDEAAIFHDDARPGLWKLVVDGSALRDAAVRFTLRDFYTSPALGTMLSPDRSAPRAADERWTVQAIVANAAPPLDGRQPHAVLLFEDRNLRTQHLPMRGGGEMPYVFNSFTEQPLALGFDLLALSTLFQATH